MIYATPNTDVDITAGRINIVGSDVEIKNFNQYGAMDVNGCTINIKEELNQFGNINVNSGKLTVAGNYTQQNGVLDLNNGRVEVTGDYRLQGAVKDENGENVYQTTYGVIKMNDADDYFLVKGNMYVQSYWGDGESNNDLTNGTLELQGSLSSTAAAAASMQKETIRSYSQAISSRLSILKVLTTQVSIFFTLHRMQMLISHQAG